MPAVAALFPTTPLRHRTARPDSDRVCYRGRTATAGRPYIVTSFGRGSTAELPRRLPAGGEEAERVEIGRAVVDVLPFGALQVGHHRVRDRREKDLDADLEDVIRFEDVP